MTQTVNPPLERLGAWLDRIHEGFQVIGHDWRYLYVNDAVCRQGKRSREELLGRTMWEAYPGIEQTEVFARLQECARTGVCAEFDNVFEFPDGTRQWFELRVEPAPEGFIILSLDITRRRALEEQLLHAQKMEAVGRLAGGLAHDFNNLLSVVMTYAELLEDSFESSDPRRDDAAEIMGAAERAAHLTSQLLTFSRKPVTEPRLVDINVVTAGIQRMLSRLIGTNIEVSLSPNENLRTIRIDPGQLEQVIVNLLVNARDAMPRGGRITIETANVELDLAYAAVHNGVNPGPYVMLAVSDTGTGMDWETQRHIFEPFFTTKPAGKGTGLGLSTVFGIARQNGGDVWVYSELGRGTTFKVYFPVAAEDGLERERGPGPVVDDLRGTETILLVDDEIQVRGAARAILGRLGYQVLEAGHAGEALAILEAYPGPVALVATDVVMPGMNGIEFARLLAEHRPDLQVLHMSGFTEEAIALHGLYDPFTAFLQKPFTADSLGRRVREMLGPAPSS